MRIRFGEGPQSAAYSLYRCREHFMETVGVVCPTVRENLFPTDQELIELDIDPLQWRGQPSVWGEDRTAAFESWLTLRGVSLADHIEEWQRRWNLNDSWCIDIAFATLLRDWPMSKLSSEEAMQPGFFEVPLPIDGFDELPKIAVMTTWHPSTVPRSLMKQALDEHIDRQLDAIEAAYEGEIGLAPSKSPEHFIWLAQFQVGRWTYYGIAKARDLDAPTVSEAVHRTADLIGLTLRPTKRGRPKGSKDKTQSHSRLQ